MGKCGQDPWEPGARDSSVSSLQPAISTSWLLVTARALDSADLLWTWKYTTPAWGVTPGCSHRSFQLPKSCDGPLAKGCRKEWPNPALTLVLGKQTTKHDPYTLGWWHAWLRASVLGVKDSALGDVSLTIYRGRGGQAENLFVGKVHVQTWQLGKGQTRVCGLWSQRLSHLMLLQMWCPLSTPATLLCRGDPALLGWPRTLQGSRRLVVSLQWVGGESLSILSGGLTAPAALQTPDCGLVRLEFSELQTWHVKQCSWKQI